MAPTRRFLLFPLMAIVVGCPDSDDGPAAPPANASVRAVPPGLRRAGEYQRLVELVERKLVGCAALLQGACEDSEGVRPSFFAEDEAAPEGLWTLEASCRSDDDACRFDYWYDPRMPERCPGHTPYELGMELARDAPSGEEFFVPDELDCRDQWDGVLVRRTDGGHTLEVEATFAGIRAPVRTVPDVQPNNLWPAPDDGEAWRAMVAAFDVDTYWTRRPGALHEPCPGTRTCMSSFDGGVWIGNNRWKHHFLIDYGAPGGVLAGDPPSHVWKRRVDAAIDAVAKKARIREVDASCGMVELVPARFGAADGISVAIEPDPAAKHPMAVSPQAVNEAYAKLRREAGLPKNGLVFDAEDLARMAGGSSDDLWLRYLSPSKGTDKTFTRVTVAAAWSPGSRDVYLFASHQTVPVDEIGSSEDLVESEIVTFLRSLGVKSIRFAPEAACEIPEALGVPRWRVLKP